MRKVFGLDEAAACAGCALHMTLTSLESTAQIAVVFAHSIKVHSMSDLAASDICISTCTFCLVTSVKVQGCSTRVKTDQDKVIFMLILALST